MGQVTSPVYAEKGMWDFRGSDTKQFTHCFHIYPAMMIPQIARELFVRYGVEGGLLFDPYCGTGTSLVESRLAGMNSIGTDINPTARMIANSKTTDYDLEMLDQYIEHIVLELESNIESITEYSSFIEPEYVTWERLEDWFPSRSIAEISYVLGKINEIEYDNASLFMRVALSECLRLVSYQRNGEFKLYRIPPEKRNEYYEPLLPKLLNRIQRNRRGLGQYYSNVDNSTTVKICDFNTVHDDGREYFPSIPGVDLVITSPPYGDSGTTVAYAQFSWLSNVWLGLDDKAPGALDRELMGGRRVSVEKFGYKPMDAALDAIAIVDEKRSTEVMHFYKEYLLSIQSVASQIKSGGHVCYVVGNRVVKGKQLPTDQFTAWAFEQEGFQHITTYVRDIPNKRMPSRNSPSNKAGKTLSTMVNEFIVVCRKN